MQIHLSPRPSCSLLPSPVNIPVRQRNEVETDEGAEGHAAYQHQSHRTLQLVPQT